ncbi:flagellar hook-length control protein FliK [Caproiciproducens sp.]|uniref:flagellar hook-length control protein FliK n=1 Tax=Caproiciproducens sp. TaxID=1954376 RepID=UPI00289EAF2C|nr:flagellar hook-length control protein FliK [Caproiciproducens sp.]
MIQQITRTAAPQNTKASRTKDSTNAFESLMRTAALGKTSDSTAQPGPVKDEKKENGNGTAVSTVNLQPTGTADVSLLVQLLPAAQVPPVSFEASGVQPQTIPTNLLPSVDTVQQPAAGVEAAAQQVQTKTATAPLLTADAVQQPKSDTPATGSVFYRTMADAAPSVNAAGAQEISVPDSEQQSTPVSPASDTKIPVANDPSVVYNTGQTEGPEAGPPQTAAQMQPNILPVQQNLPQTQVKRGTDESSTAIALETLPGDVSLPDEKNVILMDGSGQSQNTARFSDLYQTGNVVIKISDASSDTAKTTCHQVADKILLNYKAGKPEFQMDLYPQNLGKVSVKLSMQSGVLTVAVQASNPKTQSMLMENSSDIRSFLQTTINQPVQILEPAQEKAWYQQNQQNQQSQAQQQQEEQRQNQNNSNQRIRSTDSGISTGDFLSVMQQLRQLAYPL